MDHTSQHFHIIKNFNDKVVPKFAKTSRDVSRQKLIAKVAESLRRTRYILMSSRETLQRKDREAAQGKLLSKDGTLFQKAEITRRPGSEEKYDQLIRENQLLFALDLIKLMLSDCFQGQH